MLTQDQIDSYRRNGYITVEQIFPAEQIVNLCLPSVYPVYKRHTQYRTCVLP